MAEQTGSRRILGQPHVRVDGILKVTGKAVYPADKAIPGMAYARLVTSPIGRGRISSIDYSAARAVPGVLAIMTHENMGTDQVRYVKHMMSGGYVNSSLRPLSTPEIHYAGQIVALIAASTLEAASEAAAKLIVHYDQQSGVWNVDNKEIVRRNLSDLRASHKERLLGDIESGLKKAKATVEETYQTPIQHHNPMELFTTTCVWNGPRLTVYEPTRYVVGVQHGLAAQLGLEVENVQVIARFLGGHFGSKLGLPQYTALVAIAAKQIGRPLTLATTRTDGFTIANHRPDTVHRMRLGAAANGKLTALSHEATCSTSHFDLFAMEGTDVTSALYACENIATREMVAQVDRNTPGPMRAPPEVPYMFALESAIDELAHKLDMDPIEFRRINETSVDPVSGKQFTTRHLMKCFDEAAAKINWRNRVNEPAKNGQGEWLVGFGCASAARPVKIGPATMRLKLMADLKVIVETAHHEIGNGLYTILGMAAADMLGLPFESVKVYLGDSTLPPAGVSGGSATTTSLINAMAQGCATIKERLVNAAANKNANWKNQNPESIQLQAGRISGKDGMSLPLSSLIANEPVGIIETLVEYVPPGMKDKNDAIEKLREGHSALITDPTDKLAWTFGAQFAEVHVHATTGEIRVPRLVGCFAAGRILNPLTAQSQLTGGMIWGMGSALFECTEIDANTGGYVNANFAEYLVPTFADTGEVRALVVTDEDHEVNPEGIKGLGEIGIIGVNAAIANAVFNATGRRIRKLPIRIENALHT